MYVYRGYIEAAASNASHENVGDSAQSHKAQGLIRVQDERKKTRRRYVYSHDFPYNR